MQRSTLESNLKDSSRNDWSRRPCSPAAGKFRELQSKIITTKPNERGATIVEFALSAGIFVTFIVGAMQLIHFGYTSVHTQHALNQVARWASVQDDPADGSPRVDFILNSTHGLINKMSEAGIEVSSNDLAICPISTSSSYCDFNGVKNTGEPRDFVKYQLRHEYGFIFNLFNFEVIAVALIKNEPYKTVN